MGNEIPGRTCGNVNRGVLSNMIVKCTLAFRAKPIMKSQFPPLNLDIFRLQQDKLH